MKPGATTRPRASIMARPRSGAADTAAILPPVMPDVAHGVEAALGIHDAAVEDHEVVVGRGRLRRSQRQGSSAAHAPDAAVQQQASRR